MQFDFDQKLQGSLELLTAVGCYFRDGQADEPFIDLLHETAAYLATRPHLKVISFHDLVSGKYPVK